jgi:glyoxylase-like metal-dependent hydrolase (beta-lactamase superfamily II)
VRELAPGVWHVRSYKPGFGLAATWLINAYVVDDVLIDAATRHSGKRILRDLEGHEISAHALTHAHPDHQGASHEVCEKLGIPFWVPQNDIDAAENPDLIKQRQPNHPIARFFLASFIGPGHKVDRALKEGDRVGSFKVIDAPGHSAGQVVFWRESDKVLIIGDVLANMDQLTGLPGLNEPKTYLTPDPAENRRSARKLAALEPELVLFGHGRPLRDPRKFVEFIQKLPED